MTKGNAVVLSVYSEHRLWMQDNRNQRFLNHFDISNGAHQLWKPDISNSVRQIWRHFAYHTTIIQGIHTTIIRGMSNEQR